MIDPRVYSICEEYGCDRASHAKGLCHTHYRRLRLYGSARGGRPEQVTPGVVQEYFKTVVLGYDGTSCLIWPFSRDRAGYAQMKFEGKLHRVHRLVCKEANGEAMGERAEAAHSCASGHLGCVAKNHLRWATRSENQADMVNHGNSKKGSLNHSSKITEDDVKAIRELLGRISQTKIAARFGISQSSVSLIATQKNWSWLT